jgi:hypothetical protein
MEESPFLAAALSKGEAVLGEERIDGGKSPAAVL